MADFCLVSRRTLEEPERLIFSAHHLLGADWRLCCRRFGMDRGSFFHTVYDMERRLGRVFAELEPYALYPLSEYFAGSVRRELGRATAAVPPLRPGGKASPRVPLSA